MNKNTSSPHEPLIETAVDAQQCLWRAMHRLSLTEWAGIDLTMGQLKALLILDAQTALTVSQLATKMDLARPAASILIDKLVQAGYVEREEEPTDRRRTNIRLSATGLRLVGCLMRGTQEKLRAKLARLAPDDLHALIQGFRALADVILEESPDPTLAPATQSAPTARDVAAQVRIP
jgi:DNA-binding MarR family transcriptional regulator